MGFILWNAGFWPLCPVCIGFCDPVRSSPTLPPVSPIGPPLPKKKFHGVVGQYLWVTEQMERHHVSAVSGSYVEDSVQWYLFCEVPCHIVESKIKRRDPDFFVFIYGLGSCCALTQQITSLASRISICVFYVPAQRSSIPQLSSDSEWLAVDPWHLILDGWLVHMRVRGRTTFKETSSAITVLE